MPTNADTVNLKNLSWSILSRGVTGSGKTIASCGEKFRPCYVFDCDQRMLSVIEYYKKLYGHCKGVYFDSFAIGEDFKKLDEKMDEIEARPEYKTIIMASLTSYIHIVLGHVLGFKARANKGKKIANINVSSIEDFNVEDAAIIYELLGFMKRQQNAGINIILEAHLTPIVYNDLEGNTRTVLETLTKGKKAPASIPGYFDESYYFYKEHKGMVPSMATTNYKMSPVGNSTIDAKTSRGITEIDWTNKDFSELLFKQVEISK